MRFLKYTLLLSAVFAAYALYSAEPDNVSWVPVPVRPADEEVCLSEYRYDFDQPVLLLNQKEPVTRQLSGQKMPYNFQSFCWCKLHYRSFYFSFSSFLRNRQFVLGEHSSLRAPPVVKHYL